MRARPIYFTRREFCTIAGSTVASIAFGACSHIGGSIMSNDGRLIIRPHGSTNSATGRVMLGLDGARDAILQTPSQKGSSPLPLFVMLHGAGQNAEGMFE